MNSFCAMLAIVPSFSNKIQRLLVVPASSAITYFFIGESPILFFVVVLLIDFSRFDSTNATLDCIGRSQAPLPYRLGLGRYHRKFLIPNQKRQPPQKFS